MASMMDIPVYRWVVIGFKVAAKTSERLEMTEKWASGG